jgi:hypothetical protein
VEGTGGRLHIEDREQAILRLLQREPDGASVPDIWRSVTAELHETVTTQAYYKILRRLVAVGKLEEIPGGDGPESKRYRIVRYLFPENALTLDDVYELLDELAPSDAIARIVDAREYYEERRRTTLQRAARAWLEQDPRELTFSFILAKSEEIRSDLDLLEETMLRDAELEHRVDAQIRELWVIVYGYLGLSKSAINVDRNRRTLDLHDARLRAEVARHVFGERCIRKLEVDLDPDLELTLTVAGSDGSTHASVMQVATAKAFVEDVGNQVVSFNNSVVRVKPPAVLDKALPVPYYSVPPTRSALDDPGHRGMVMAPFMYPYLAEGEYEHLAKCATDVVQWRADREVFLGTGRALGRGEPLPKPRVHLRDGTIVPQEREYNHYQRGDAYGAMVREAIAISRQILDRVTSADGDGPVFGGAVKATQVRFFSALLNWFIAKGSRTPGGEPIDATWDTTRAAYIADNEAMTYLLAALEPGKDDAFVTFAVSRPFSSTTEFVGTLNDRPDSDWPTYFAGRRDRELEEFRNNLRRDPPYLATVGDIADEDFVRMCQRADYVSFYVGHTGSEPPPIVPRYEFLDGLRAMRSEDAEARVDRRIRLIVNGLRRSGLSADRDHNFLSAKSIVRILPFVIQDAHEKCKAIGHQIEGELRSAVIARLRALRNARELARGDVTFKPMSVRGFLERYRRALGDEEVGDR